MTLSHHASCADSRRTQNKFRRSLPRTPPEGSAPLGPEFLLLGESHCRTRSPEAPRARGCHLKGAHLEKGGCFYLGVSSYFIVRIKVNSNLSVAASTLEHGRTGETGGRTRYSGRKVLPGLATCTYKTENVFSREHRTPHGST